jgi:hypothetical protein
VVNGETAINSTDVFYRDKPRELDSGPCDSNPQGDDGRGLLGPLLGGLIGSELGLNGDGIPEPPPRGPQDSWTASLENADTQADLPVQQKPLGSNAERCLNAGSLAAATQETDDPIGFQGVFFRHVP